MYMQLLISTIITFLNGICIVLFYVHSLVMNDVRKDVHIDIDDITHCLYYTPT